MRLKITVDLDNASFQDGIEDEIKATLDGVANWVIGRFNGWELNTTITIRDSNGNTVGTATAK